MLRIRLAAAVTAVILAAPPLVLAGPPARPIAPKRPVTDTYWGVEVVDEYQYLEQVREAEVVEWADGQNRYTRHWLDGTSQRQAILDRIVELTHNVTPQYFGLKAAGNRLFAIKRQPPKEQPFLVVFPPGRSLTGERVLVDPNDIDHGGSTSIDFFVPSLDGSLVAVSLSRGGTENGTLHIFDTATGREHPDLIHRVNGGTAGGSVAWTPGSQGLFYTRYPAPGERPDEDLPFYQQVWYHALGTPTDQDYYVLGKSFPRIAEIELQTSEDGRYVLAEVSNGDGGEYAYWLKGPDRDWTLFAEFADQVIHAAIGHDDALYLLSRQAAPHKKILRLALDDPQLRRATEIVPETDVVIRSYLPTATSLYVVEMLGGPMRLRTYDLSDGSSTVLDTDEPSTISGLVSLQGDEILLQRQSYLTPPAVYRYRAGADGLESTPLAYTSPADYSDCEVRRVHATADDGTRIPITIVLRAGTPLDGSAPLLLYGYGSYGFTMTPFFSAHRRVWIEQGGIYAVANIRGGGAFGDHWHRSANLQNKKVTMDDFAACARFLGREYSSPGRIAIQGGSAGGLMVFGVLAHHPQVCAAVLAHVGISDALRTELSPNGEFNSTEFGTVRDETQFHGMLGYSPYHAVKHGTTYPAVMATTGMNDPRVEPWQSFKMVAALQASGTPNPVLLRVSHNTGHGGGTRLSERDQQLADSYTFLFAALDLPYRPVGDR